jgi:hypothetical protein
LDHNKCTSVCPCTAKTRLFRLLTQKTSTQANAHRSFADPTGEMNDIKKKHREKYQFGKKNPRRCNKALFFSYRSILNLQVAPWTYMFLRLGLKALTEHIVCTKGLQCFKLNWQKNNFLLFAKCLKMDSFFAFVFKVCKSAIMTQIFFSWKISIWVSKNAEFYAVFKFIDAALNKCS